MSLPRHPRGPYKNGILRRHQIIATASEVFATYGYRAGSLRQIAQRVGVSPAALVRHFDSKEDLLVGVLEYWAEQTSLISGTDREGLNYFEGLRSVMRYHVEHRGFLELFLTLSAEASNPEHPAAGFIRDRYAETLTRFTRNLAIAAERGDIRPHDEAEAEAECRTLISVMDGLELQWLLDPDVELVPTFDRHLDLTLSHWKSDPPKEAT